MLSSWWFHWDYVVNYFRKSLGAKCPIPQLVFPPVYHQGLTLMPAWISNYIHYIVEWNYLSIPQLQWCSRWSWEWIRNFIPHLTSHVITFPCQCEQINYNDEQFSQWLQISTGEDFLWALTWNKNIQSLLHTGRWEQSIHDDVIKWKHFARYWPFMRGIHRSPVNSPHKSQWHGA